MDTVSRILGRLGSIALSCWLVTSPGARPVVAAEPESEASKGAQDLSAACAADLVEAREIFSRLESHQDKATTATVLEPYNELIRLIHNGAYEANLVFNVHPEAALREAAAECEQQFSKLSTEISLSRPVFDALAAVDLTDADSTTRYFVDKELRDFRLNGVDKDEATRSRIQALNEELVKLGQEFTSAIAQDVRSIEVSSAEELAGLPEDWIAAHPPDENGKIRITTDYPDFIPFNRYAERDDLRRALYFEFRNRGYPANESVLKTMLDKRFELAQLLGFETWADRALVDKMTGTPEEVHRFLHQGFAASETRARRDYDSLLKRLREIDPEASEVNAWQSEYLQNLIRKEQFAVNPEEIRPYFEYTRVRDGIFDLVRYLFGVTIRQRQAEAWHQEVEAYEVLEGDRLIGRFFLDMHPREGKFKHAGMFPLRDGLRDRHLPEAVLACNFPGGGEQPGLMEQDQVETFLHEFGHLMHWMFMGRQRWVALVTPEWDFIEAPSMMLEEWIYDTESLQQFATNAEGKPIPADLVAKMRAARDFGQGLFVQTQMVYSAISLHLHDRDPKSIDIEPLVKEIQTGHSLFPYVDGTHMYASFGHLDGYSAFYYTYMWSLVIAYDMFSRFESEGVRNTKTAREYRDKVLATGGAKPAAEFVQDFLGRPYNVKAFERRLNVGESEDSSEREEHRHEKHHQK